MTISKISTPCLSLGFFFLFMFVSFGLKAQNDVEKYNEYISKVDYYLRRGDYDNAKINYDKCKFIYLNDKEAYDAQIKDKVDYVLLNYGLKAFWDFVYVVQLCQMGQAEESEVYCESFIKSYPNHPYINQVLELLGLLYQNYHNYQKSKSYFYRLKDYYEKKYETYYPYHRCLVGCMISDYYTGDIQKAKTNADYLLLYFDNFDSDTLDAIQKNNIVEFYSSAGAIYSNFDRKKTLSCYVKAINFAKKYNCLNPTILNNFAEYQIQEGTQENYQAALENLETAFSYNPSDQLYFQMASNSLSVKTLLGLELCKDVDKYSRKLKDYISQYFSFLSAEQRSNFIKFYQEKIPSYNSYLLDNPNYYSTIYDNLLFYKGLLLKSSNKVKDEVYKSNNQKLINDYNIILELNDQILQTNNQEIIAYRDSLEKQLLFSLKLDKYHQINNLEIKQKLKADEMAIEFFVDYNTQNYYALLQSPKYSSIKLVELCNNTELDNLQKWYQGTKLYDLVWQPLEKYLDGINKIYFSPDYQLHIVAIENAICPDGKMIGDKFDLYRVSSTAKVLDNLLFKDYNDIVLIGGIKYQNPSLFLPGSKQEVEDISSLIKLKNINQLLLTSINGTSDNFRSLVNTKMDILHISTHGYFYKKKDELPLENSMKQTGLLFSNQELSAAEIANLNFKNLDLVVLSACKTGLGQISGEGVFGLQRGFLLSGAKSILMTLYKIDDDATCFLMREFYQNLLSGQEKHLALKQAIRAIRKNPDYQNPIFWSGFVMLD